MLGFFLLLSVIVKSACDWFNVRFEVGFEEILFTITSPLEGSDVSFLNEAIEQVIPSVITTLCIFIILLIFDHMFHVVAVKLDITILKKKQTVDFYRLYRSICCATIFALCYASFSYAVDSLDLDEYIARKMDKTTIYEEYYVNPDDVVILNSENPRNLIYIYLESMETTYASTDVGGFQSINYIPLLTELAEKNISFSHNNMLGGACVTCGAGWTMGALFSSTSGIPFSFPVEGNSINNFKSFAPGVISLGDILEKYGYTQVFLCGSDGTFARRQNYFEQHGNYNVIDYYDTIEKGYIDENYCVWWGIEDAKLYDIAKTELLELSRDSAPFNFTMLTVDTHHVDGYVCDICNDIYDSRLANVLHCADNQIYDFINWCMEQDFYDNTVIVLSGDHLRMDSSLVEDASERRIYNCFINSVSKPKGSIKNRIFTSLDLFPTTLSAMGFEIQGDRLGLGMDLFSGVETLPEKMGFDTFNAELGKYSKYYEKNFE